MTNLDSFSCLGNFKTLALSTRGLLLRRGLSLGFLPVFPYTFLKTSPRLIQTLTPI
jgi:hypothetical protein